MRTKALLILMPLVGKLPASAQQRPNIVMLMTDDTGWNDFGAYGGGANLGHPTPNIDRVAQEGAVFTSWYGQASCTAGRASPKVLTEHAGTVYLAPIADSRGQPLKAGKTYRLHAPKEIPAKQF
jgi:hypothetical protein